MRIKVLAPVAIAAALTLSACTPLDFVPSHTSTVTSAPASSKLPDVLTIPAPTPTVPAAIAKVATPAPTSAPVQCEEDQPCWDCHTMGNHICGPTSDAAPLDTVTAPVAPENVAPAQTPAPVAASPVQPRTAAPATPAPVQTPSCESQGMVTSNGVCLKFGDGSTIKDTAPVPAVNQYSGNPVVNCVALGKITAEDGTCVAPNYYPTPAPTSVPCASLQLGDGGTTQQHNCTPAPGQPAPHATTAPNVGICEIGVSSPCNTPAPTPTETYHGCLESYPVQSCGPITFIPATSK